MRSQKPDQPFVFKYSYWDGLLCLFALLTIWLILSTAVNFDELNWIEVVLRASLLTYLQWFNYISISHNFIHTRFFKSKYLNNIFSVLNSIALGVPQSIYEANHLNHHQYNHRPGDAGSIFKYSIDPSKPESVLSFSFKGPIRGNVMERIQLTKKAGLLGLLKIEVAVQILFLILVLWLSWKSFLLVIVPAYYLSQVLAIAQNYFEHYGTQLGDPLRDSVSSYDPIYNFLWFNNGLHAEHHYRPKVHWTRIHEVTALLPAPPGRLVVKYHHFTNLHPDQFKKNQRPK